MEMPKKIKKENSASRELDTVPEEPAADTGEVSSETSNLEGEDGREEDGRKRDESEDFSFPDTTISLTHLQSSR